MGIAKPSFLPRAAWFCALACIFGVPRARADLLCAWGYNAFGDLGDGTTTHHNSPELLTTLTNVQNTAGGDEYGLAIQNGALYAWGYDTYGQLGDRSSTRQLLPIPVPSLSSGITAVSAGWTHTLAIKNGSAYSWGNNSSGELGNGTTSSHVDLLPPAPVLNLSTGVTAISAGFRHNLAIQNGAAYAWGVDSEGKLGDGSAGPLLIRTSPVPVTNMTSGVTAVSAGYSHSLAIKDGAAYAWGDNTAYGELGTGNTTDSYVPVPVLNLSSGVTDVSAGYEYSLALKDGHVYAWGHGGYGQLGDGDNGAHFTPIQVPGLSSIVDVETKYFSSYALSSDGRLWSWGYNYSGQLGLGDTNNRNVPTLVTPPNGYIFTGISAGRFGVIATVAAIPEPATLILLSLAGASLLLRRDRLRAASAARLRICNSHVTMP